MVDVELALRAVCITNELPLHCRGSQLQRVHTTAGVAEREQEQLHHT
jgi:hypothetical protein